MICGLERSARPGGARLLSSRRPMQWDGIPGLTLLGKVSLFLLYRPSARMARQSLSPPRTGTSRFVEEPFQ